MQEVVAVFYPEFRSRQRATVRVFELAIFAPYFLIVVVAFFTIVATRGIKITAEYRTYQIYVANVGGGRSPVVELRIKV